MKKIFLYLYLKINYNNSAIDLVIINNRFFIEDFHEIDVINTGL